MSSRKTFALARDIRAASGSRKVIETDLKGKLVQKNHVLDEFFEHRKLDYKVKVTKTKEEIISQHTIVCNDLPTLIDAVIQYRILSDDDMIRIGLDGGGGFIKVILSVFKFGEEESEQRRSLELATRFKDSSVKKAFVISIVPNIAESYFNMKKIWINVGMHRFNRKFTIATDLKLINILLGLQSHSSMHPCCWCDIDKYNLDAKGLVN